MFPALSPAVTKHSDLNFLEVCAFDFIFSATTLEQGKIMLSRHPEDVKESLHEYPVSLGPYFCKTFEESHASRYRETLQFAVLRSFIRPNQVNDTSGIAKNSKQVPPRDPLSTQLQSTDHLEDCSRGSSQGPGSTRSPALPIVLLTEAFQTFGPLQTKTETDRTLCEQLETDKRRASVRDAKCRSSQMRWPQIPGS